jgi:hypothetical protein
MSNRLPPRSRQSVSPHILRRRRIFFGAALIVVIAIAWGLISSVLSFFGGLAPQAEPTPGASQSVVVACEPGMVQIIAGIGDDSYNSTAAVPAGVNPFLWFNMTNNSKVACTFDAGSLVSFYQIKSGEQLIWDSKQCDRSADVSAVGILQPGQSVNSPSSTWLRVFSSITGCSTGQEPAVAGGATYQLKATVNGVESNIVQFTLN